MLNHPLRMPLHENRGGEIFKGDLMWETEKRTGREKFLCTEYQESTDFHERKKFEETQ